MPTIKRTRATLVALVVLGFAGGCDSARTDDGEAAGRCAQFESFAGRVDVVGQQQGGAPTRPEGDIPPSVPVPTPADAALPGPGGATVESIDVDPDGTRVVFALGGAGPVGWSVRFVQQPFLYGQREPVQVKGSCVIQIDLMAGWHGDGSGAMSQPLPVTPDWEESTIEDVRAYPAFPNLLQTFVGIRSSTATVAIDAPAEADTIVVSVSR